MGMTKLKPKKAMKTTAVMPHWLRRQPSPASPGAACCVLRAACPGAPLITQHVSRNTHHPSLPGGGVLLPELVDLLLGEAVGLAHPVAQIADLVAQVVVDGFVVLGVDLHGRRVLEGARAEAGLE